MPGRNAWIAFSVAAAAVVIGIANVSWPRATKPAGPSLAAVDWQDAASCLIQRWDPYNESLAQMGAVVRFCATTYQGLSREESP